MSQTEVQLIKDAVIVNADVSGSAAIDASKISGTVTAATTATNVTVADESSDTTCFPLFATAATGNLPPKSGSNLTFNSNTGVLTATSFSGSGATTINSNAVSRVILGSDTADTLNGEAGLTFTSNSNDHIFTITGQGQAHLNLISTSGTNHCSVNFGDSDDNDIGEILYTHSSNAMQFVTNANERMRIDSTGKVGIGTQSPTATLHVSGDYRSTGRLGVGAAASHANIVSYVTGTGSYPPSGGMVQADNADSTAMFWNGSNSANYTGLSIECRTTGASYWMLANVHNSSFSGDLAFRTRTGGSTNGEKVRFRRDGGITFGGDTAAANALDDYEEGSWTATMHDGNGSNVVLTSQENRYTKIGRLIIVTGNITLNDTGKSGEIVLTNLPFTSGGFSQLAVGHFWVDRAAPNVDTIGGVMYATASNTSAYFVNPTGGASGGGNASNRYFQFSNWANGRPIYFSLTYQTA